MYRERREGTERRRVSSDVKSTGDTRDVIYSLRGPTVRNVSDSGLFSNVKRRKEKEEKRVASGRVIRLIAAESFP